MIKRAQYSTVVMQGKCVAHDCYVLDPFARLPTRHTNGRLLLFLSGHSYDSHCGFSNGLGRQPAGTQPVSLTFRVLSEDFSTIDTLNDGSLLVINSPNLIPPPSGKSY